MAGLPPLTVVLVVQRRLGELIAHPILSYLKFGKKQTTAHTMVGFLSLSS